LHEADDAGDGVGAGAGNVEEFTSRALSLLVIPAKAGIQNLHQA
jgi:hypothetical protein